MLPTHCTRATLSIETAAHDVVNIVIDLFCNTNVLCIAQTEQLVLYVYQSTEYGASSYRLFLDCTICTDTRHCTEI
jgi:hypothetical protein